MALDDILVARRYPVTYGLEEAEVDRRTAIDMYQQLQEVCSTKLLSSLVILCGLGVVAQIDKSLLSHKPKVNILVRILHIAFIIQASSWQTNYWVNMDIWFSGYITYSRSRIWK